MCLLNVGYVLAPRKSLVSHLIGCNLALMSVPEGLFNCVYLVKAHESDPSIA